MFVWNNEFLKGSAVFFASLLLNTGNDWKEENTAIYNKSLQISLSSKRIAQLLCKVQQRCKTLVLAHPRPCKKKLANLRRPVPGHSLYMFLYKYTFMYNINWYKYIWKLFAFHKCTETHKYIYIYILNMYRHIYPHVSTHTCTCTARLKISYQRTTNVASYFLMFNSSSLGVNHFASSSNRFTLA